MADQNPFDDKKPDSGTSGSGSNPVTLSQSQVSALKAEADRYRAAQRQMLEALGVLWNAQLDVSISTAQPDRIQQVLQRPVAFYDNCSCGGTGPACW